MYILSWWTWSHAPMGNGARLPVICRRSGVLLNKLLKTTFTWDWSSETNLPISPRNWATLLRQRVMDCRKSKAHRKRCYSIFPNVAKELKHLWRIKAGKERRLQALLASARKQLKRLSILQHGKKRSSPPVNYLVLMRCNLWQPFKNLKTCLPEWKKGL